MQLERAVVRPQTSANRPDSPFVPLVGESAVRLAHVGLSPLRVEGIPAAQELDGARVVRVRRDRVGRTGEFRAFVLEGPDATVASLVFVPRPSLDLGVFSAEIATTSTGVTAVFAIHAGTGTWFAGQHAHRALQEVRRAHPALVADDAAPSARARQRGFAIEIPADRALLPVVEDVHRRLWASYVRTLADALELDAEGSERNTRAVEAWRAHRRTVSLVARVLTGARNADAARLHAEAIAG